MKIVDVQVTAEWLCFCCVPPKESEEFTLNRRDRRNRANSEDFEDYFAANVNFSRFLNTSMTLKKITFRKRKIFAKDYTNQIMSWKLKMKMSFGDPPHEPGIKRSSLSVNIKRQIKYVITRLLWILGHQYLVRADQIKKNLHFTI